MELNSLGRRRVKSHRTSFERENMFLTGMSGWEKSWGLLPLQPPQAPLQHTFPIPGEQLQTKLLPPQPGRSWGLSCLVAGTAATGGVYQATYREGTGSLIDPPEIYKLDSIRRSS